MSSKSPWAVIAHAAVLALVGCDFFDQGDPPPLVSGRSVGESCGSTDQCRAGLICDTTATCQPSGTGIEGSVCVLTADCTEGLFCGADRTCAPAGDTPEGGTCSDTADCARGLTCEVAGFFPSCGPSGDGDLAAACTSNRDCLAGLTCLPSSTGSACLSAPAQPAGTPTPPTIPIWTGVDCGTDTAMPTAYFRVPRADSTDDFFRLPYPNDARRRPDGTLDLTGFPGPGETLPLDVLGRYVEVAETDLDGFGRNVTAHFRFSTPYDWESVGGALHLVDVDPDSSDRGARRGLGWLTTAGPISRYLCENWLGVRTHHGDPLRAGTTYALIVTRNVRPADGGTYTRDADLDALLADAAPSDAALASAWASYAPLRSFLAEDTELGADDVLVATVFTTQSAPNLAGLRAAVHAAALPTASDVVACGAGVTSPCDDGTDQRSCAGADGATYTELHGRLALPRFQRGTAPYRQPADGGDIVWNAGTPQVAGTDEICFALTVPNGEAPAEGWPLVVVGHGTGGSFRNTARNGVASALATATHGGAPMPIATLAIDLPAHGARRGTSTESPDVLFFNVENPRAARDNVIQGAADVFSLIRFATEGGLETSPVGEVRFDPSAVAYFGHSQGAIHGDLVIPYESALAAAVLSGASGALTLSMLHKTSPTNVAAIVPFALLDADGGGRLAASDFHPVLALFQSVFESADPVNHVEHLARRPIEGVVGRHVFTTFGDGDTYTPRPVQEARAVAAGLPHVAPRAVELPLANVDPGLTANVSIEGAAYTFGLRSYVPPMGVDGHFVAFENPDGRADVLDFVVTSLAGEAPVID
ncbi:MAG: hypothetical protein H6721_21495 [Sandaracinus sp.]|nr:hypothetical protein [Sandaracinus sp.]MCB9634710.1 hypothetical protein [Sandaracinus sp.]